MKQKKNGADYLGVGAVFGTTTKKDAKKNTIEILSEIAHTVKIPVVAIGGINADNVGILTGSGISGVAVVSGIISQKNITEASHKIFNILKAKVL